MNLRLQWSAVVTEAERAEQDLRLCVLRAEIMWRLPLLFCLPPEL